MTRFSNTANIIAAAAICLTFSFTETAQAQMNNQPFQFNGNPAGAGMSVGGRQAILNDKVLRSRPDNLVRSPSGRLLDVQPGPGSTALATEQGTTQFIPQYRGGDYRSPDMAAGVFNPFFSPAAYASGYIPFIYTHSGATISTWTGRITTGMPVSYLGDTNEVDVWTGQVFVLSAPYARY